MMSARLGKVWRIALAAILLVSLGYNALWLGSATWILELSCISHTVAVHAQAIESERAREWRRAAHLYAYLEEFGPNSELGCRSEEATTASWLLPLGALAWRWRFSDLDDDQSRIRTLDEQAFRAAYTEAARHLDWDTQASLSR